MCVSIVYCKRVVEFIVMTISCVQIKGCSVNPFQDHEQHVRQVKCHMVLYTLQL